MSPPDTREAMRVLYNEYLTPCLAEHRFNKAGRTYRFIAESGDHAIVNFQPSSATTKQRYEFYVNLSVVPLPWFDWMRTHIKGPEPTVPGHDMGLLTARLEPSALWGRWVLDSPGSAHECGRVLTGLLPPRLEDLKSLLDRENFLKRLHGEGPPLMGTCDRRAAEVVLLVDQGMTGRLALLLNDFDEFERRMDDDTVDEGRERRSEFATWARVRAKHAGDAS